MEKTAKTVVRTVQDLSELVQKLSDTKGPLWASLENINKISANMQQITSDLKAGKGPMGALLKSEDLLQKIVNEIETLGKILDTLQVTVAQGPETMDLVRQDLSTFKEAGQSVQARVEQVRIILDDIKKAAADLRVITDDIRSSSGQVPKITTNFGDGVQEIRQGVEQINRVVDALQKNVFIRSNLPEEPGPASTDAGARPVR